MPQFSYLQNREIETNLMRLLYEWNNIVHVKHLASAWHTVVTPTPMVYCYFYVGILGNRRTMNNSLHPISQEFLFGFLQIAGLIFEERAKF